jgi:hypothetical protein
MKEWDFGFHKLLGISWVPLNLLNSEVLLFMKWVNNIIFITIFYIIIDSMVVRWAPKWSLSLTFPHQTSQCSYLLPIRAICPVRSISSLFHHLKNIGPLAQILKLLFMKLSPLPCYVFALMTKYSPQRLILQHSQPAYFPQCQRTSVAPKHNNTQNSQFCKFLDREMEDKTNFTEK